MQEWQINPTMNNKGVFTIVSKVYFCKVNLIVRLAVHEFYGKQPHITDFC